MAKANRNDIEQIVNGICVDVFNRDLAAVDAAEELMTLIDQLAQFPVQIDLEFLSRGG